MSFINMSMRRFTIFIVLASLLLSAACASGRNFGPRKARELKKSAEEILGNLGYKDFTITTIAHVNFRPPLVSIQVHRENFAGNSPKAGAPKGVKSQPPPGYDGPNYKSSTYRSNSVTANYSADTDDSIREYLDYISIIIVFPELSRKERVSLANLLMRVLVNNRRPDSLVIISRRDFARK